MKWRKFNTITLAMGTALTLLVAQMPIWGSAVIAGTDPLIDPSVNTDTTLPDGYDQAMEDGLPNGVFVVGNDATYSFGTAVDSKGNLYYASFTTGKVQVRSKDAFGYVSLLSPVKTINLDTCIFSLAFDSNDNILYSVCYDSNGYVALYNQTTGSKTVLISGLVRPCQVAADKEDNVYVACEDGTVKKWTKSTGEVSTLASGLTGAQSVVVSEDGTIYALAYSLASDSTLIGVAIEGGTLYQINTDGSVEEVAGGDNQYVWRARGLTTDENGYVYLTGEANAWDNGNSSLLARYNPGTREIEPVESGLDYATFVDYGDDGRFYMCAARDNLALAYSEKAADEFTAQTWNTVSGSRVITYGGSFAQGGSNRNLTINVGSLTLSGTASLSNGSNKVCGWISVPADSLPEISKDVLGSATSGKYATPAITTSGTGTVATSVMVLREHVRSRWPMVDLYTNSTDFSEAPEAYLVYFEWTSIDMSTYTAPSGATYGAFRNTSLSKAGNAYNSYTLGTFDFSKSSATVTADTTDNTISNIDLNTFNASTLASGNELAFRFKWLDAASMGGWMGVSVDNRGTSGLASGEGLKAILWNNGSGNVTARVVDTDHSLGWDAAGAAGHTIYDQSTGGNFNDSGWHTFKVVNNFGTYEVYVDNVCISTGAYSGFQTDMDSLAGGTATTLTFFSSSGNGKIAVQKMGVDETISSAATLDFLKSGYTIDENGVYTATSVSALYGSANLETGVAFQLRYTGDSWLNMNIDNSASHGSGLGDGYGIHAILWNHASAVEAHLISQGTGWDTPYKNFSASIGSTKFSDGEWHTVSISKAGGTWSFKVDGTELITGFTAEELAALDTCIGGSETYIHFGNATNLQLRAIPVETQVPTTLDFLKSGYTVDENDVYTATSVSALYGLANLETGVAFQLRYTGDSWLNMNIDNSASHGSGLGDGYGIHAILWNHASAVEAHLITQGTGWDTPYKNFSASIGSTKFSDGEWHTVSISKAGGSWSFKVDGTELITGFTAEELAALDTCIGGSETYIHFGNASNLQLRAVPAETPIVSNLDFVKSGYTADENNVYTATSVSALYGSANLETGVAFQLRYTGDSWLNMNIDNSANHGSGLGDGYGIHAILWNHASAVEAHLITQGTGWDTPYKNFSASIGSTKFSDGEWHTVIINKASGSWSFKIDGTELITSFTAEELAAFDTCIGGSETYIHFGNAANLQLRAIPVPSSGDTEAVALQKMITKARSVYNKSKVGSKVGQVSSEAKTALQTTGLAAIVALNKTGVTSAELTGAYTELENAFNAFKSAIVSKVNYIELATMLQSADSMLEKASVGTNVGQVPQENYDSMTAAIAAAVNVYTTSGVTQAQLDAVLQDLTAVVNEFASAVVTSDKVIAFDFLTDGASINSTGVGLTDITLNGAGSMVYTEVNATKLAFKLKVDPSQTFEWFAITLSNSGADRLATGNGITGVFWLDYKADVRVVEEVSGKGWEGALDSKKQVFSGSLDTGSTTHSFKDGEWHDVVMQKNTDGTWIYTIDGISLLTTEYSTFDSEMNRLLAAGNTVTMTIYTNGAAGSMTVQQDTTGAVVSFSALQALVDKAQALLDGTTSDRAEAAAFTALQNEIDASSALMADANATYAQVEERKKAMTAAIDAFEDAIDATLAAHQVAASITAFGSDVNEDNLYDAVLIVSSYEALTDDEKAMLDSAAMDGLNAIRQSIYLLLRSDGVVSIGGNNLPYYIKANITEYGENSSEWTSAFANVNKPVALFMLSSENYLTSGAYTLGSDGDYTVTLALPDKFKGITYFTVAANYTDGTSETLNVKANGTAVEFIAKMGGTFAVSVNESALNNTDSSNIGNVATGIGYESLWLAAIIALLATTALYLARKKIEHDKKSFWNGIRVLCM